MYFILLHADKDTEVRINFALVRSYWKSANGTRITFLCGDEIEVMETPQEIRQTLKV
jgi:hypothetical protein